MELRHFRYFVAVAEELHFGRAAQRLNISQPPLSQQIKVLEEELGAALFKRTTQHVQLTNVGNAVLQEAYRLLEQVERVRLTASQARVDSSVALNVGGISSVLYSFLPRVIAGLRTPHPEMSVTLQEVDTTTGVAAVRSGQLHAVLVRSERLSPPLKAAKLTDDWFIAAVPAAHPLAKRKRIPIKSLAGEPLIVFSRKALPRPYANIVAACAGAGFSPEIAHHSPTVHSQLGAVASGLGIALVPSLVRDWAVPDVVYLDLDTRIDMPPLSVVWNGSSELPALAVFLQAMQQHAKDRSTKLLKPRR
jgi:DNA-binding transcriptional LysR family regulator